MNREPKLNNNRQKKMEIVTELSGKFGKAKAVVFTNYQGLTHKQIEGFKRAIKPLQAEYVVAKNSLLTIALSENKINLKEINKLDGQTGTLFLYEDVISPLKALAKVIKELSLPGVKFGIMENDFITGEQVLKLSTLPSREVLLAQLAGTLKGPISGLHRALNWNIQKLVMTLNAITNIKPKTENVKTTTQKAEPVSVASEPEPETILAETAAEIVAEQPESNNPTIEAEANTDEGKINPPDTQDELAKSLRAGGGEN